MTRRHSKQQVTNFSEFIADPPIAGSLVVFGLIALILSILEFTSALAY